MNDWEKVAVRVAIANKNDSHYYSFYSCRCESPMIVCVCNRVSHRDIDRAVAEGCCEFEELQLETGVATACGSCNDCAQKMFFASVAERVEQGVGRAGTLRMAA